MDNTVSTPTSGDRQPHPLDKVIILAKYSRMIISVSVAAGVLTYLYLFCSPNLYKTAARLLPPQQNLTMSAQILDTMGARFSPGGGAAGQAGLMGGAASTLLGLKSPAEMFVAMMTSDLVVDHIIDRFHLMKPLNKRYREDAREKLLKKYVNISAGKKDNTISIEITWRDRRVAVEMANAFIEELDRLLQNLAIQETKGRLAFLEKERGQSLQKLSKAEESMRKFSEQHGVLQIETQTRGAIQYIASLRAEIDAKEVQGKVLRYQATPGNPDLIKLETAVNALKEKLRNAESQLENCMGDVCLPTSKTPALTLEYIRLFRETKFQESLYLLYSKMVEIARLDLARDFAVVQVISPAPMPERRANKRIIPSIIAGLITFFVMVLIAFGCESMQKLNNCDEKVQRLTELRGYLAPWQDILSKLTNIMRFNKRL
jgi:tyrosine-protein kinase Etk/Wzc